MATTPKRTAKATRRRSNPPIRMSQLANCLTDHCMPTLRKRKVRKTLVWCAGEHIPTRLTSVTIGGVDYEADVVTGQLYDATGRCLTGDMYIVEDEEVTA